MVVGNTANRTAKVTAGEFSVVKTGDNLALELGTGVGVAAGNITNTPGSQSVHDITAQLTDSSFNHLNYESYCFTGAQIAAEGGVTIADLKTNTALDAAADYADGKLNSATYSEAATVYRFYKAKTTVKPNVIVPDVPREKVLDVFAIDNLDGNMGRGTGVYSALSWTMTFTVSFAPSSLNDVGLFFDLSSSDTWAHEKFVAPDDDGDEGAGTIHTFTAAEAGTYYTDAACTLNPTEYGPTVANKTVAKDTILYKKAPESSGKGFRIAFVPTAVSTNSIGYTKIWAPNQNEAGSTFAPGADNNALTPESYGSETLQYNGSAYTKVAAPALIHNGITSGIPTDGAYNDAYYMENNANYLGFFKLNAGNTASLTYTCVAWFEGTDANVDSEDIMETVVTSMKFGVTNLAA